ncbi:MAG: hypothetical protein ACI8XO_003069 [Verrucomicrobiales bacterium]|jgi:hypothetical protein
MAAPNDLPGKSSGDRQHLKFNSDVLPDFKRRPDSWEGTPEGGPVEQEQLSEAEADSIIKWVGLGIMLLVVGGIIGVTLHNRKAGDPPDESLSAIEEMSADRAHIKEVVKNYMEAKDPSARLAYVRRPDDVWPLMERYYEDNEIYVSKVNSFKLVEPLTIESMPFWSAVAEGSEGPEKLLLEKVGGDFKIDWETHVGFNPMRPEDFLKERPSGKHEFRVYVSPGNFYNPPFADSKYQSAELGFPNSGVQIDGYIEKASEDHSSFLTMVFREEATGQPKALVPLILELEWPEETSGLPQVKINKLVSEHWLVIE